MGKSALRVATRYGINLLSMVYRQHGPLVTAGIGAKFALQQLMILVRGARMEWDVRTHRRVIDSSPPIAYSPHILHSVAALGVEMVDYKVDRGDFLRHVSDYCYPPNYAAGPMSDGGQLEQKQLEYFVSLDLLSVCSTDIVIDVASEWSLFPEFVQEHYGAEVYRQDLIYPLGVRGRRIGGSATKMPVCDGFADKIVLHNAYEHFEGVADTEFIGEAWRVLKPGGKLCILPLFMSDQHTIVTDPLVNRSGIKWDEGARIVELPWWHNRFGRSYDATSLQQRVLAAAGGFHVTIYHVANVQEMDPRAYLHFALLLQKPFDVSN